MTNYNNWCIQNEIIKQVNRESIYEWAKTPNTPLPTYKPTEIKRDVVWWANFFKTIIINPIKQLKP